MNREIYEKAVEQEVIKHLLYVKENLTVLLYIRSYSIAQMAQAIGMRPQALQDFIDGKDLSILDMDEFLHISYVLETPLTRAARQSGPQ